MPFRKDEFWNQPPKDDRRMQLVLQNCWLCVKMKRYQQVFPYCKAAGWDIAITDDGPVVIEVNDFWDRTGQYFIRRGWRDEIRDCYLAWKKTGKNYHWMGRKILHPMN